MVRWTQKAADWQRAYSPTERGQDKRQQKSPQNYPKILCNARATLYESEKKMPYVQNSFRLLDGCTAHIHRPTLGRTVREYILLCKVSLLHSPSSLGLDGHEQLLSRLEDAQEVPKEPSSPCWLIGFPCTALLSYLKIRQGHPGLGEHRRSKERTYREAGGCCSSSSPSKTTLAKPRERKKWRSWSLAVCLASCMFSGVRQRRRMACSARRSIALRSAAFHFPLS